MRERTIENMAGGKGHDLKPGSPEFTDSNEAYGSKDNRGFARTRMATLMALFALFCVLQLRAQTPPLAGIAHVAFRVADLDKSRAFYHTLGFEQAFEFADDGKTSVVFIKINDNQFIELYPRTGDSEPLGLAHVCFETNALEALRADYLRHGLEPSEIEKGRAGNLLFDLLDFEGQLLEYTQYLPGSLHSMDHGKHLEGDRISQHLLEAAIPVRNIAAARRFYATKLRFEPSNPSGVKLRLPGNSEDQIELASAFATKTARITFAVENTEHTATNLHRRGFKVRADANSVSISDPNGPLIVFREVQGRKR